MKIESIIRNSESRIKKPQNIQIGNLSKFDTFSSFVVASRPCRLGLRLKQPGNYVLPRFNEDTANPHIKHGFNVCHIPNPDKPEPRRFEKVNSEKDDA